MVTNAFNDACRFRPFSSWPDIRSDKMWYRIPSFTFLLCNFCLFSALFLFQGQNDQNIVDWVAFAYVHGLSRLSLDEVNNLITWFILICGKNIRWSATIHLQEQTFIDTEAWWFLQNFLSRGTLHRLRCFFAVFYEFQDQKKQWQQVKA